MRLLVTGATGFVGAHSAAAAVRAGHDVRLLVRDPAKADRVAAVVGIRDAEVVVGDVTDRPSVERGLAGCDAVLHAAAAVSLERRRAAETMEVNTVAASNVLGAAAERGLGRMIYVSSTSALDPAGGAPLGVDSPVATTGSYAASKGAAEAVVRGLQHDGAPVHITYPSGVIGPAAGGSLGETSSGMARFVAAGIVPTPRGSLSLIDVRDLADIHCRLLEPGERPLRVMCGGTHLTMSELAGHLRAVTGRRFAVLPTPPAVLRGAGRVADRLASLLPFELALSEESMSIITTWPGTDDNARAELGIRYRPVGETLAAAVEAWVDAGLLTARQAGSRR